MNLERDRRIFASLVRKAQDPGIPVAERQAFRAKAEEIHRRLAAFGAPRGEGERDAPGQTAPPDAQPATTTPPQPEAPSPAPAADTAQTVPKARQWRPVHGALACCIGLGIGFAVQNSPGAALVVLGLVIAAAAVGAAWMRRTANGNAGLGSTAG